MYFDSPHKSGDFLKFPFELGTTPAGFAGRPTLLSDQSCKDCKDQSFYGFLSLSLAEHLGTNHVILSCVEMISENDSSCNGI